MIKLLRGIGVAVFSLFIGGAILISSLFALIQTDLGKETLHTLLVKEAATHHLELTMDPIKGRLPFRWKVSNVHIKTPDDLKISINKVKGRIGLFALLKGELFFKSLKIFQVKVEHPTKPPSPLFSIRGKGKWIHRIEFFGVNVRAYLEEDPQTHLALDAHYEGSGNLSGALSFSTPSTEILSPYFDLPIHGPAAFKTTFSGDLICLHVEKMHLSSPLFSLDGEVSVAHAHTIEESKAQFQVHYPFQVDGTLLYKERHLEVRAEAAQFTVGAQQFTHGEVSLTAQKIKSLWDGSINVTANGAMLPLELTAHISIDPKRKITLEDLNFHAPQTTVGGKLAFHFPQYSLEGALFAQATDLSLFGKLLPDIRLNGRCGGEVTFTSEPQQTVGARLVLDQFQLDEMHATQLTVKLDAQNLFDFPEGIALIEAEELTFRNVTIEQGALDLHSENDSIPFQLSAKGSWGSPLDVTMTGAFSPFSPDKELAIDTLEGALIGKEFHLLNPISIAWSKDRLSVSELALDYTGGWLKGACLMTKETLDVSLKSEHFPLELLSQATPTLNLSGGTAIDCELHAQEGTLQGHLNLLLEEVRLFQYRRHTPLMAKGSFSANINNERLQLHTHLLSSGHQFFTSSASIPLTFSHNPHSISFDRNKPFSAQLFLDGRLEEIFDFLNLGSQEIKGHMMGQIFFSNTLSKPLLKGGFKLLDGGYENFTIGTSVKEIRLEAIAENDLLTVTSAAGIGPKRGTAVGSGALKMSPAENFPFHFEVQAQEITGIDFDVASARVSGPIYFDGTLKELLIHGKGTVTSADIKIPDGLPIDIPNYPVEMIHPPSHLKIPPRPRKKYPVRYDLKLKADDHVNVHGRGLSSEWKGKAHIKGEGANYTGKGTLSLIRGEFNFSGKRFSLTKGEINFSENGAFIDLRGNLQLADATITAVLSGSLTAPSLTFQSNPSMPTSSILARLIFDKDMSEITPFQALQLAQMIVTLSGDSGPNVLEKIRKSLGVDRFNIVSGGATGEEISLQIGKYLTQGVMITLSQSAHSSQVIVEVELKGGFIFQAETQEEEEGKFSLKWNHNY